MATITISNELDVIDKFNSLVKESLSTDSVYIRMIETLDEMVEGGAINETNKTEVLSAVLSSSVTSITNASMATALEWAKTETEFEYRKLAAEKELDILDQELLLKTSQVAASESDTQIGKIESKRMHGTATFDVSGNITSLDSSGKVWTDMQLILASIDKTNAEELLTEQKMNESYAAVHKIVADTYVNYGNYNYSELDADGITTVTANHGAFTTLSDTQQSIAVEQSKGYVYNAWANALTGASSMLGTAIAADYAEFGSGQPGGILLDTILDAATNLKNADTTDAEASPAP